MAGFQTGVRPYGVGVVHELFVERFELGLDNDVVVLFADREVLEDGEVEQATLGLRCLVVGTVVAVDQEERFVERGHDVVDLVLGGLGPVFDLGSLVHDAGLFGVQDVLGDGVAVVKLDQLLLLGGQFAQTAGVALALTTGDERFLLDGAADPAADLLAFFCGQPVGGMDGVELVLDGLQADVAGAAGAARGNAAQAGVVLVVDTHLAAVPAVAVGLAAAATAQLAGQVVVVFVAAAAAGAVAVEGSLGALEGVLVDERVVAAAQLDAAVGDDAKVVVVSQHPVHRADRQRLGGTRGRWSGAQASFVQELGDGAQAVLAGGGEIEGHPDQRRAFGVDRDAGDLAVLDRLADVQVAQAGRAEGAAFLVLALHAQADLLAVVA